MSYVNVNGRSMPFVIRYIIELFTYRHLMWSLVGSDLRSRFRRSYFGILWSLVQPLGFALALAYVWANLLVIPDYWTFLVYVYAGLIVWEYFSNCVVSSQDSLLNGEGYLKQTRIPFLVFQLRPAMSGLVVLAAAFCGLIGLQVIMGKVPIGLAWAVQTPAAFVVLFLFMAPMCIVLSVLGTQFRDLKHLSTMVVSALFLLSPVMFERAMFDSDKLQLLRLLNPMITVLDMFRAAVVHGEWWTQEQGITIGCWIVGLWTMAIIVTVRAGRRLVFAI